ncbi:AbrB/MazE/SpoVT family DNA-binding domain-containing protein [Candidatus Coxiella mudrowiae]|uniref:AbrB/MazE/SpoVT family DNA-binding domain-containing protein n=1 Tax=Candidatus Coxiella mudrowiae TaxID=2054173 RepID=UPI000C291050|nr:AbrB/MazE/SpoVT family DNA-binding domain-containing protein [Candidatus Coxiella mudrowiae]
MIPEEIREQLGLETGTKFVVIAENDTVVLKTITPPSKKKNSRLCYQKLESKLKNRVLNMNKERSRKNN